MSVELPLWRALTGYRILTACYAVALFAIAYDRYAYPLGAAAYVAALALWTGLTWKKVTAPERCSKRFLVADLSVALAGILLTLVVDTHARITGGAPTLPSIWTAGAVLGFALKGGWRWAAVTSAVVAVASVVERGSLARDTVHNLILVWVASVAIGYVVEVARASERTLARALQIEAATRERERLARDIHDSVLQVLAMVQRRGAAIGGEAAELGRMAGEQEVALRTLVSVPARAGVSAQAGVPQRAGVRGSGGATSGGPAAGTPAGALVHARVAPGERVGSDRTAEESHPDPEAGLDGEAGAAGSAVADGAAGGLCDLRALLAPYAGARVSFAEPGAPVLLEPGAAAEVAAAVGAALHNVRRHAGAQARAWILLEDAPDAVLVTVRDDGPGIPEGRLAAAEREGRLGVALSIRGRLRDLGGSADLVSVPGQGTEVELRVPRAPEHSRGIEAQQ